MLNVFAGSVRIFRAAGVDVYLHWSWFVVAFLEVHLREGVYENPVFNALEYLTLFLIVLLHEFGHALACRAVGGRADRIVLWPLGGIAFVAPPQRPGAVLWSIAAGPLVNVALVPFTVIALAFGHALGWPATHPGLNSLLWAAFGTNLLLLGFNLLPVYPLDGGQILYALLWFVMGRAHALLVVSIVGFVGAAGLGALACLAAGSGVPGAVFLAVMAVFLGFGSAAGVRRAQALARALGGPRHANFSCPACGAAPPVGEYWLCKHCGSRFDLFEHLGICPGCGQRFGTASCPYCQYQGRFETRGRELPAAGGHTGPS